MVRKIIRFLEREIGDLHEAAYLLGAFAFISQVLGFLRDRLLASQFGAGVLLDTYYASFRIPDLLFTLISTLVSLSVLVPFIIKNENKTEKERQVFIDTIFTIVTAVSLVLVLIALVLAQPLLTLMFPVIMSGDHAEVLLMMTRVMLLQPIILAFSSFFSSYIQVYRKFFIYALSPILYNVGIILGILVFYPKMGPVGLVLGVIVGALFHLVVQLPTIIEKGLRPKVTTKPDFTVVKDILALSIPRTFALAGSQVAQIVLVILAGLMVSGSISIFTLAFNLQSVPIAIIGISYSLAAFPTLSRLFIDGNMEVFVSHIVKAARHIIFWSIPVMVMFITLRAQIVRTILGTGEFNWNDTRLVAAGLAIFSLSIVGQSLNLLFVRGYYSAGETRKPLIFSLISVVVTIVTALGFIHLFNNNPEFKIAFESLLRLKDVEGVVVLMLPIAFSLGQLVNTVLLWVSFDHYYKWFSDALWKTLLHSVVASLIAGAVTVFGLRELSSIINIETSLGVFLQGLVAGAFGIFVALIFLILVRNEEIKVIWDTLHRKIFKAKFIGGE